MVGETDTVHFDSDVATTVLRIFDDAKEYVVAVSPWLHLWGHAKNAIRKAKKRQVDIFFVIRKDDSYRDNREADLKWLREQDVRVFLVEGLHAKIYFNEETVLLSSMNLLTGSSRNSLEVACTLIDRESQGQVRHYVKQSVIGIASEVSAHPSASQDVGVTKTGSIQTLKLQGFCLRCKKPISFNESKPLCPPCYKEWAHWKNPDYMEKFCHKCGSLSVTSFSNPTCYPCFSGLR